MSEPHVVQTVAMGILGACRLSDGASRAETDSECSVRTGIPLIDGVMVLDKHNQFFPRNLLKQEDFLVVKRPQVYIECEEKDSVYTPIL